MSGWVLIIMLYAGPSPSGMSAVFYSAEKCEIAGKEIERVWAYAKPRWVCVRQ